MENNKHLIDKKRIQNYMGRRKIKHDFRVEMIGGGQYLDNFLIEFAQFVRTETINEIQSELKELKNKVQ